MRVDEQLRLEYAGLKRSLLVYQPGDRAADTRGKAAFVEAVLGRRPDSDAASAGRRAT